jgi:hypothetical protein
MVTPTSNPVTLGDIVNAIVAAGIEPLDGSVDDTGLTVIVDGRPVRIAFLASMPSISGGSPEEPIDADWEEYGEWSASLRPDRLSLEGIENLAAADDEYDRRAES